MGRFPGLVFSEVDFLYSNTIVKQSIFALDFRSAPRGKMPIKRNGFCIGIPEFSFCQNRKSTMKPIVFFCKFCDFGGSGGPDSGARQEK